MVQKNKILPSVDNAETVYLVSALGDDGDTEQDRWRVTRVIPHGAEIIQSDHDTRLRHANNIPRGHAKVFLCNNYYTQEGRSTNHKELLKLARAGYQELRHHLDSLVKKRLRT